MYSIKELFALFFAFIFVSIYSRNLRQENDSSYYFQQRQLGISNSSQQRVLVIVSGSLRGGPAAWRSLQRNVLDFYHADLALLGPLTNITEEKKHIHGRAKYTWEVSDTEDWTKVLTGINGGSNTWLDAYCGKNESRAADIFSGVGACHHGFTGVQLAYRAIAASKLRENRCYENYDWIMYTRSDYLYICPPPSIVLLTNRSSVSSSRTVATSGAASGAASSSVVFLPRPHPNLTSTERFTIFPTTIADRVLGFTADLLSKPDFWLPIITQSSSPISGDNAGGAPINLDRVREHYFTKTAGLSVERFHHTGFITRPRPPHTDQQQQQAQQQQPQPSSSVVPPVSGLAADIMHKYDALPRDLDEARDAENTCSPTIQQQLRTGAIPLNFRDDDTKIGSGSGNGGAGRIPSGNNNGGARAGDNNVTTTDINILNATAATVSTKKVIVIGAPGGGVLDPIITTPVPQPVVDIRSGVEEGGILPHGGRRTPWGRRFGMIVTVVLFSLVGCLCFAKSSILLKTTVLRPSAKVIGPGIKQQQQQQQHSSISRVGAVEQTTISRNSG